MGYDFLSVVSGFLPIQIILKHMRKLAQNDMIALLFKVHSCNNVIVVNFSQATLTCIGTLPVETIQQLL